MPLEVSINLNSLRLIQEELTDSLNHSATDFEAYVADRTDLTHIRSCLEGMIQVGGTFRLIQFPGAALLADEMTELIRVFIDPESKVTDTMINALTHAYFVLPRYIEYITVHQHELPILIIPYVNELRISRKAELLPERHFFKGDIASLGLLGLNDKQPDIKLLLASIPRLRHMYQTGLVGVIKEPNSSPHYLFMSRALTRIVSLLGSNPYAEIWKIADVVLQAFAARKLEMTLNRKRNLADIEKLMRAVSSQGEAGLAQQPPAQLKQDLFFLLMLVDVESTGNPDSSIAEKYLAKQIVAIRTAYSLPDLVTTDGYIAAQRAAMHGPSIETLESVTRILSDELRNAKDILEIGSQNNGIDIEDRALLKEIIRRVADTLSVLNLQGPQAMLTTQLEKIASWGDAAVDIPRADFLEAADTVLYVESALSSLDRRELTVDDLNRATALTRKKIVASSQLAQAEQLVIEEAQAGISLAKRAITSYVESNFDVAHISNVGVTLKTVRGGLHILNYRRAAAVLQSCSNFISSHIEQRGPGDQRHQLLETLADALISLEYYLSELETNRQVNENILEVAEQSLEALGFSVVPTK